MPGVTLIGMQRVPLLTPLNFLNGRPRQFPATVITLRPLLGPAMGRGYIAESVFKQESSDPAPLPISRRVVLLLEPSLQCVAETWSDPLTGAYRFDGLNTEARFTVVSFDHTHHFRAVIADNLAPMRGD